MTDLTTLAAVKAYVGVSVATDDAVLTALITAYSQFIRSYLNRDISVSAYSIYFDGRNNTVQMLPQWPIVSVTSLLINGVAIGPQAAFGQAGYRFDDNSIILDCYRFTTGQSNVQVGWTAGYATIPTDIAQAVNELVGLRYANKDHQGWSTKMLAGESVSLITKSMPDSVMTILNNYRSVVPL
jgi:hypothetical protein